MRCDNVFSTVLVNAMRYGRSFPYESVHPCTTGWRWVCVNVYATRACNVSTFLPLFNRSSFKRGIILLLLFGSFGMWTDTYVRHLLALLPGSTMPNIFFSSVIDGTSRRTVTYNCEGHKTIRTNPQFAKRVQREQNELNRVNGTMRSAGSVGRQPPVASHSIRQRQESILQFARSTRT